MGEKNEKLIDTGFIDTKKYLSEHPTLIDKRNQNDKSNKEKQVMIRMESELKELLDEYITFNKVTTSDFIREAIIEKIVKITDINKAIKEKQEMEIKYANNIQLLQTKINEDFFDKTFIFLETDELYRKINRYNALIKWYYEHVLQK